MVMAWWVFLFSYYSLSFWEMANGAQSHDTHPGFLRKQLAVAVKSIQWSYAIFWSLSTRQHGVLEWCDGYYNGDIKTRKTVQTEDVQADKMGLHRSEQLRELYNSLLEGETDPRAKKPPASLSPEDLSDAECLPGRALAAAQTIWLCNAQCAESRVFSRSLLAKSASIQTVVCFPYLGGVIELGVTEQVAEDLSLLQHVKDFLLKFSKPICSKKSSSAAYKDDNGKEPMCAKSDNEIVQLLAPENLCSSAGVMFNGNEVNGVLRKNNEELRIVSRNDCEQNHRKEGSLKLEGMNEGASHYQSVQFLDDDFSFGIQDSMNPSDCISEALVNREMRLCCSRPNANNNLPLKEVPSSNHTKSCSMDIRSDEDIHYKRTLFTILGSSTQMVGSPHFHNFTSRSGFVPWKKGMGESQRPQMQQKMLKRILFTVPLLSAGCSRKRMTDGEQSLLRQGSHGIGMEHVMDEKLRENEKFMALKSMLPSLHEIDKVSILNDTIKYLKMLEGRVEELEACMDSLHYEERFRRKYLDAAERTSDNYDYEKIEKSLKSSVNKRKACEIDETGLKLKNDIPKDGSNVDVKVSLKEQEVQIEMQCPYRECILVDVMGAVNDLQLDAYSVQSSDQNGVFSLTLKSKFRGTAGASVGMMKLALLRVANKY